MKKRDLLDLTKDLGDDEEVVLTLTYPKPEEGFTMGEDDSPTDSPADDSNDDEDDGVLDNEDGTVTEFYSDFNVDIVDVDDEEGSNVKKKVAFLAIDVTEDEDEDEDGEEDGDEGDDD